MSNFLHVLKTGIEFYKNLPKSRTLKEFFPLLEAVYNQNVDEYDEILTAQETLEILEKLDITNISNPLIRYTLTALRFITRIITQNISADEIITETAYLQNFKSGALKNIYAKNFLKSIYEHLSITVTLPPEEEITPAVPTANKKPNKFLTLVAEKRNLQLELAMIQNDHQSLLQNVEMLKQLLNQKEQQIAVLATQNTAQSVEIAELKAFINGTLTQLSSIYRIPLTPLSSENNTLQKFSQRKTQIMNTIKENLSNTNNDPMPFIMTRHRYST